MSTYPRLMGSLIEHPRIIVKFVSPTEGILVTESNAYSEKFGKLMYWPNCETSSLWEQVEEIELTQTDIDPKKFSFVEWGMVHGGYEGDLKCSYRDDTTANNGGKTDYYQLSSAPFPINDFDDFAEWRGMDGFQFNMGKAMWTFNVGRHEGTDEIRDLNKIIHYAKRRIAKLKRSVK